MPVVGKNKSEIFFPNDIKPTNNNVYMSLELKQLDNVCFETNLLHYSGNSQRYNIILAKVQ